MSLQLVAKLSLELFDPEPTRLERHAHHRLLRPAGPEVDVVDGIRRWHEPDVADRNLNVLLARLLLDEVKGLLDDLFRLFNPRARWRLEAELELARIDLRENLRADNEVEAGQQQPGKQHVRGYQEPARAGREPNGGLD